MRRVVRLDELIFKAIQNLKENEKKEVMKFIEFLRIKEDNTSIDYVNRRTEQAIMAKKWGERFISLEELQKDYANLTNLKRSQIYETYQPINQ
jgi:hypothetical protein